ncbi:hypothetical protein Tco_1303847 [Tanacetum coccineum]
MLGAHSKLSQPLIELWELGLPSWMIAHVGVGFSYGDGFGWMWGVNEVERDRFGGLCDLAGKLVEDVQYFNFQVWVWGFVRIGPPRISGFPNEAEDCEALVIEGQIPRAREASKIRDILDNTAQNTKHVNVLFLAIRDFNLPEKNVQSGVKRRDVDHDIERRMTSLDQRNSPACDFLARVYLDGVSSLEDDQAPDFCSFVSDTTSKFLEQKESRIQSCS